MLKNAALVLLPFTLLMLVFAVGVSQQPWGPGPVTDLSGSTYSQGGAGQAGTPVQPMTSWVTVSFRGPEGVEVERVDVDVEHGDPSVRSLPRGVTLVHVEVERRARHATLIYRWEGQRYSQAVTLTDTGEHLYQ